MVKRKKHQFHCNNCNSECMIYKKGKAHRVLVCPQCGVLATNPFSLGGLAKGIVKNTPVIGTAYSLAEESGLLGGSSPTKEKPKSEKHIYDSLDKPNKNERYVKMALGG